MIHYHLGGMALKFLINLSNDRQLEVDAETYEAAAERACRAYPEAEIVSHSIIRVPEPTEDETTSEEESGGDEE